MHTVRRREFLLSTALFVGRAAARAPSTMVYSRSGGRSIVGLCQAGLVHRKSHLLER
jgi:hypothetical protein